MLRHLYRSFNPHVAHLTHARPPILGLFVSGPGTSAPLIAPQAYRSEALSHRCGSVRVLPNLSPPGPSRPPVPPTAHAHLAARQPFPFPVPWSTGPRPQPQVQIAADIAAPEDRSLTSRSAHAGTETTPTTGADPRQREISIMNEIRSLPTPNVEDPHLRTT